MLHFKGSTKDIGNQEGEYYRANKVVFAGGGDKRLLKRQRAVYKKYAPEILEEIAGIAAGGRYDMDAVASRFLTGEIQFIKKGRTQSCSIGGVTITGKTYVGRNYDEHPASARDFQAYRISPKGRLSAFAVSDMCIMDESYLDRSKQTFFHEDAINEAGLFIGMTFAFFRETRVGIISSDVIKLVAARCRTVEDVIAFFEKTPVACAKNYFFADRSGKMAVVQHTGKKFSLRRPDEEGILVLTNHYDEKLKKYDRVLKEFPKHTTFTRYDRLYTDLKNLKMGKTDIPAHLDSIFTSKTTPVCQCLPDGKVETVWTLLMAMQNRDYRLIGDPRGARQTGKLVFAR